MDNSKVGELIRRLRKESHMTQLQLAEKLHVSDKAVSKWKRGMGCPEVSLIIELSRIFEVDMQDLLSGELNRNELLGGNMKKMKFYVCPHCGNLVTSMIDTPDTFMLKKQYPEWGLQVRIPVFAHGRLLWYCNKHGLFYQEV